jgi:glyoxylase-like metal-dependent hydrolase (beta-lactamase superfamily II)
MDRVEFGGMRVTLVRAGCYWWDGGAMFGVVPKTLWGRHHAADEANRIEMGFNCYVVDTEDHRILIETGGGDRMDARGRERMRLGDQPPSLPENLQAEGIDPESIDVVINSHLHWDHCGWNTQTVAGRVQPCFPRATYYARRGEWEHAHNRHPRDSVSYIDDNYDPLVEAGVMELVDDDREIIPGVRVDCVPGHNRDMWVVRASSRGQTFCFMADLLPTAAHVTPTWVTAFDLYPMESINNKAGWLALASSENWICGFSHDPVNAFARICQEGAKFRVEPVG